MRKTIISFFILSLIIPQLALASWWNPFTWFSKQNIQESTPIQQSQIIDYPTSTVGGRLKKNVVKSTQDTSATTIFYIKYDNSRLRSCASTTGCDVLGYYPKNQEINLSGVKTLSDLDDWVQITYTTDGKIGFLNKSLLSEKIVPETKEVRVPQSESVKLQKIENQTEIPQSNTSEDVSKYKDELYQFTKSLHLKVSSIKEIIDIEITFANEVSDAIKSEQTSGSISLTHFVEKVIPTRINYLNATINLLDSIDRHVNKIENLIDPAKYTTVLDIYHKSLVTDQEDILKIDRDIESSSDKFNDSVNKINRSSASTNRPLPPQSSSFNSNSINQATSIGTPNIVIGGQFRSKLTNFTFTGRTSNDTTGIRSSCTYPNGDTISIANWMVGDDEIRAEVGAGFGTEAGTYVCYFSIDGTNIKSPNITIQVQ